MKDCTRCRTIHIYKHNLHINLTVADLCQAPVKLSYIKFRYAPISLGHAQHHGVPFVFMKSDYHFKFMHFSGRSHEMILNNRVNIFKPMIQVNSF